MLILGIDPGTATTGYGLLKVLDDASYEVMAWGLIETQKNGITGDRLQHIHKEIDALLIKFRPDVLAIEKIFFANNAKTAIAVGQAQGVMLFAASVNNVTVAEYSPPTIKKMISGDGRADKKVVQKSLRKILGAKVRSEAKKRTHFDDAADALAVAICHAIKSREILSAK